MSDRAFSPSLRLPAALLLVGQLLYIVVTQLHADGHANDHPAVFAEYAASGIWTAVHVGQFAATAVLLAGLFALFFALDRRAGTARWAARLGAASAAVTLALYGVVMAVDGVALKQSVDAWASAPDAEKATRFATAEAIRWVEWGARSYQELAMGLTLLLFAAAVARTAGIPRPVAYLMALSGVAYLAQGWVAGTDGFTRTHDIAIVLGWVLDLAWMVWLAVLAWRTRDSEPRHPTPERAGHPHTG
ncbi:MAG: hypothetical protein ACLGIA_05235 [Actinomycetes bacterium]